MCAVALISPQLAGAHAARARAKTSADKIIIFATV
jgi:hypothetical protein